MAGKVLQHLNELENIVWTQGKSMNFQLSRKKYIFLFLEIKFDVIISKYRQNLSVRFKQLRQKQLEGLEMIFSIDCF